MYCTYDCVWMDTFLWSLLSRGRYYYQKIVSHEPMHRFTPNSRHFFCMPLWVDKPKLVDFCQQGRTRGRYKDEYFITHTSFCLSVSKFHMLLQHHKLNICYDFHEWAWLYASVAPPTTFQKLSPALLIVRELWNSVHLYIMTRRTKKSLGPIT